MEFDRFFLEKMDKLFVMSKGKDTVEATLSSFSCNPSKHMRESISLQKEVNKEFSKLSKHEVASTWWMCDNVLNMNGMVTDFNWMASNTGMGLFTQMHTDTYKDLTLEFLATFKDKLEHKGADHVCGFTIQVQFHQISLNTLCGMFAFEHASVTKLGDDHTTKACETWELVSANHDVNYSRAKVSTIQNPTIHCFTTFLVNTIFGPDNVGHMANPKMCVLHTALHA